MQTVIRLRFVLALALCLVGIGAGVATGIDPVDAAGPGKITVSSSAITGQNGKALVMGVNMQGVPPAGACVFLDSDSYSLAPTVLIDTPGQGGPCGGSTPETVFPAGTYTVSAGIYMPGSQTPERQVQAEVVVDGDKTVKLDGAALAPGATGDVNCDGGIDSVDALFTLRRVANIKPFADCIAAGNVKCDDDTDSVDALIILRHVAALLSALPVGCAPLLAAPAQVSPPDGSVFDHFPRTTTLEWGPVPGAASYIVQVDCWNCCALNQWCSDVGQAHRLYVDIHDTSYTFDHIGSNAGRWRIWAVDDTGRPGAKSTWWGFDYTV